TARGLPRQPGRPPRPRRQLRATGRVGLCGARIPAHARVHRARRLRRPHCVWRDATRRHGCRRAGIAPALGGGEGVRSGGCGRRGRLRRELRRRRARLRLVPRADAPGPGPTCPHPTPGVRMNLTVNGVDTAIGSGPLTSLLDVLREELGITSPKAGCEQGGCGACTVLVDGEPRRSCLTAVASVDGAAIRTVEGLGTPDDLSPIQQAFTHHYA